MTTALLAILVIAALALWSWRTRGGSRGMSMGGGGAARPAKKNCKWVPDGEAKGRLRPFRCKTCGVTAFSQHEAGPELCKRGLTDGKMN
ncbi:hypothetical protein GGQ68_000618 [Sagittula marina]|uniref:Uncharacterized protein n=1 Tax=Sagittula marina TaxID=943940 RepID=A0A7W6DKA1_9RHOB|nr:hypothetical protein [Sagittula marina]MBB3984307.1 hypothetical protein [Sagittula marina]